MVAVVTDARVSPRVDAWGEALSSSPGPAVLAGGEVLRAAIADNAAAGRDPWGQAWAPHSPTTIAVRLRRTRRGARRAERRAVRRGVATSRATDDELVATFSVMIDSGRSVRAISFRLDRGGQRGRVRVGPLWNIHQGGARNNRAWGRGRAPIPARPILPIRGGGQADVPGDLRELVRATMIEALRAAVTRPTTAG